METLIRAGLSNAVAATVLALGVACLARPLARRPAVLHGLWLLVLLKLVTPPLYEVPIPIPWSAPAAAVDLHPDRLQAAVGLELACTDSGTRETDTWIEVPLEAVAVGPNSPVPDGDEAPAFGGTAFETARDWLGFAGLPALAAIWLGGIVACLVVSLRRVLRFQGLLHTAWPASLEEQEPVAELASLLGVHRTPHVGWIRGRFSPMIWSLGRRPRLIIPCDLWKCLDPRQQATLIVHELAHLHRGDHLLRFFELLVTALYWWNPLVWWVRHALRDAEEQCCDAWVVWAFPDSARSYAETLLETLDFLHPSDRTEPLLASGFGKVHHLRRRLTMIMSGTTPRVLSARGLLGLLGLATVLLPVGATWAQKPEKPEEVEVVVKTVEEVTPVPAVVARVPEAALQVDVEVAGIPEVVEVVEAAPSSDLVLVKTEGVEGHTEVVEAVETAPVQARVIVKTDESPEIVVAGSIEEAIAKLKKELEDLADRSSRSEPDNAKRQALEKAVAELTKAADQVKRLHLSGTKPKPGTSATATGKRVVLRRIETSTKDEKRPQVDGRIELRARPVSPEQKADIDKARSRVKQLREELTLKQNQLGAAERDLAKLSGVPAGALVLRSEVKVVNADEEKAASVAPKVVKDPAGRTIVIERKETRKSDEKPPVVGIVKKVDPVQPRFELRLDTDRKVIGPKAKPGTAAGTVKAPSEDQRIEQLERVLKKLTAEVDRLKKDQAK